jgi:hypothetical protein
VFRLKWLFYRLHPNMYAVGDSRSLTHEETSVDCQE